MACWICQHDARQEDPAGADQVLAACQETCPRCESVGRCDGRFCSFCEENVSVILRGQDAVDEARARGVRVNKFADPEQGERLDLDPDGDTVAEILSIDPSLIWVRGWQRREK